MNEKWDKFYLELAEFVANKKSKDPSTKVGAVLVNYNRPIPLEFIGYNGFPCGVHDDVERYNNRELKYEMVVHAEVNAILKAGHYAKEASLYVFPSFAVPNICSQCAKVAIQTGIKEVVCFTLEDNEVDRERRNRKRSDGLSWSESISISKQMFDEASIKYRTVNKN